MMGHDILHVNSPEPLTIVAFDEWLSKGSNTRCDYLMFDSGTTKRRFAFCELTCSLEDYVNSNGTAPGKRAKAYSQVRRSWEVIKESDNPVFTSYVLQFVEKIGIFGWRDRRPSSQTGAQRAMRNFMRTPGSEAGIKRYEDFVFGEKFDFIQVKHPTPFIW